MEEHARKNAILCTRSKHATAPAVVKRVRVDKNILLIVNWINSFPGVTTIMSCEGRGMIRPFVVFQWFYHRQSLISLLKEMKRLHLPAHVEISYSDVGGELNPLQYKLIFQSKEDLVEANSILGDNA